MRKPVQLSDALAKVSAPWSPRLVAALNGQEVKVARLEGPFVWHKHDDADELFLVLEGAFVMQYRDRAESLSEGELIVVPRGVEHRPVADAPCSVLLFEPAGTLNTGDAPRSSYTHDAVSLEDE